MIYRFFMHNRVQSFTNQFTCQVNESGE